MGEPQFILFLVPPQRKVVFSQIKTNRYQRIVDFMKHPTSKASLCFIAFIANEFEDFNTNAVQ